MARKPARAEMTIATLILGAVLLFVLYFFVWRSPVLLIGYVFVIFAATWIPRIAAAWRKIR